MKLKTIYGAIAAFAAAGTLAMAEQSATQQPAQQQSSQPQGQQQLTPLPGQQSSQRQMPESAAVVIQEGFIKHGDTLFKVERVTKATKLEDLKADEKGHITKDGNKIELQEGQMVTPEGKVAPAPFGGGGTGGGAPTR